MKKPLIVRVIVILLAALMIIGIIATSLYEVLM